LAQGSCSVRFAHSQLTSPPKIFSGKGHLGRMARQRTETYDAGNFVSEPLSEVTMDGFLSSSWPAAAPPPRNRPEPPRAPLRKPSDVSWEVPPLELPMAPKKRSLSTCGSGTTEECLPFGLDEKSEDEENDEPAMFALDADGAEDDDYDGGGDAFQLAGFNDNGCDDDDVGGFVSSETRQLTFGYPLHEDKAGMNMGQACSLPTGRVCPPAFGRARANTESMNHHLGASPILLSVLEQVAAAQATQGPGGRCRADSC